LLVEHDLWLDLEASFAPSSDQSIADAGRRLLMPWLCLEIGFSRGGVDAIGGGGYRKVELPRLFGRGMINVIRKKSSTAEIRKASNVLRAICSSE
jgi:hypothetical protein